MIKDIEGLLSKVCDEIRNNTDVAIIGLSGGADSTLVAALCVRALGNKNVVGISMPHGDVDMKKYNRTSAFLAAKLNIRHFQIPIFTVYKNFLAASMIGLNAKNLSPINKGNIRSRLRMMFLYTACAYFKDEEFADKRVRVIGTGNLSEDYIGYDTKGGDALADFFPIGSLVKSEVYQLLDYFRDNGIIDDFLIDRVPSAGLWDGQTDEGELGYSYDQMAPHVLNQMAGGEVDENDPIAVFVRDRHTANKHKHEAPPVINLREFCE